MRERERERLFLLGADMSDLGGIHVFQYTYHNVIENCFQNTCFYFLTLYFENCIFNPIAKHMI